MLLKLWNKRSFFPRRSSACDVWSGAYIFLTLTPDRAPRHSPEWNSGMFMSTNTLCLQIGLALITFCTSTRSASHEEHTLPLHMHPLGNFSSSTYEPEFMTSGNAPRSRGQGQDRSRCMAWSNAAQLDDIYFHSNLRSCIREEKQAWRNPKKFPNPSLSAPDSIFPLGKQLWQRIPSDWMLGVICVRLLCCIAQMQLWCGGRGGCGPVYYLPPDQMEIIQAVSGKNLVAQPFEVEGRILQPVINKGLNCSVLCILVLCCCIAVQYMLYWSSVFWYSARVRDNVNSIHRTLNFI